jgi:hypothetical protein
MKLKKIVCCISAASLVVLVGCGSKDSKNKNTVVAYSSDTCFKNDAEIKGAGIDLRATEWVDNQACLSKTSTNDNWVLETKVGNKVKLDAGDPGDRDLVLELFEEAHTSPTLKPAFQAVIEKWAALEGDEKALFDAAVKNATDNKPLGEDAELKKLYTLLDAKDLDEAFKLTCAATDATVTAEADLEDEFVVSFTKEKTDPVAISCSLHLTDAELDKKIYGADKEEKKDLRVAHAKLLDPVAHDFTFIVTK